MTIEVEVGSTLEITAILSFSDTVQTIEYMSTW